MAGRSLALLTLVALTAACPRRPLPAPEPIGGPLAQRLAQQDLVLKVLRGDLKVRIKIPEGFRGRKKAKAKGQVIAGQGGRLRLEVFSPIGQPVSVIVFRDGHFASYAPFNGEYVRGPADSPRLASLVPPVPVGFTDLSDLLRGVVRIEEGRQEVRTDDPGGPVLQVLGPDEGVVQELRFHPEGGWLTQVRYPGEPSLEVDLEEYRAVQGIPVPGRLVIRGGDGSVATAELSRIEVNPTIPETVFHLPPPKGARIVEF